MKRAPRVRDRYERFASDYDDIFGERQRLKITRLAQAVDSPMPHPVLDLGAGTGLLSKTLDVPVIAMDFSPAMLSRASGQRVLGDLSTLPFADSVFGTVFSVSALIEMDDLRGPILEMLRVVKPGGWIALSVLKSEDLESVHRILTHDESLMYSRLDLGEDIGFVFRKPESV